MKAFASDRLNVGEMMIFDDDWTENIVGKGENVGYQHFFVFPQCFQKDSSVGLLNIGPCGTGLNWNPARGLMKILATEIIHLS